MNMYIWIGYGTFVLTRTKQSPVGDGGAPARRTISTLERGRAADRFWDQLSTSVTSFGAVKCRSTASRWGKSCMAFLTAISGVASITASSWSFCNFSRSVV